MARDSSTNQPAAVPWRECVQCVARSDVGLRRANNQDAFSVFPASSEEVWKQRGHLVLVADGMGAHAAGELASKLAVDTIPLTFHKLRTQTIPAALKSAVSDANRIIHGRGKANPEFEGMGTTIAGVLVCPQGAYVANVGDSRVYRLRGNKLEQLSFDHSLAWEVRAAGQVAAASSIPSNIITRSLGPGPDVEVDLEGPFKVIPGDIFLACSDGLSGQVSDEELGAVLCSLPLNEAMDLLVNMANIRGGPDNITAVACRIAENYVEATEDEPDKIEKKEPTGFIAGMHPMVLLALVLSLTALAVCWAWGRPLYTAIAALAGLIATLAAFLRFQPSGQAIMPSRQTRRSPYGSWICEPTEQLASGIATCFDQVKDSAVDGEDVVTDVAAKQEKLAQEAVKKEDWRAALNAHGRAVNDAMDQLRQQGIRGVI
ncbi:MAG: protein phosphatase 2C domain-containing protein [Pirellulales bacterium]|nr:protein phosphatase 2C domain-containing protein [Pirellulales bacterium]